MRRVGGQKWIKVDVRVIAATRRDLDRAVAAGRFRDDLFHRLAVARIELPPLRERQGDVALLARHFAEDMGGAPDEVEAQLDAHFPDYSWPGNVRELRNAVARFIALGDDALPSARSARSVAPGAGDAGGAASGWTRSSRPACPIRSRDGASSRSSSAATSKRMLDRHGGNVTHAARASGLGLRYFRLVKARRQPKK